jgi:hypothetical protein
MQSPLNSGAFAAKNIPMANLNIDQLNAQILELIQRRDALVVYRDSLNRVFSPIRKLPPELLSEIFEYCLSDRVSSLYLRSTLNQICRSWRMVALRTPRLWSALAAFCDGRNLAHLITTCFSRSGETPLKLELFCHYKNRPFLDALVPFAHRLVSLAAHIEPSQFSAWDGLSGKFSKLRHLQLSDDSDILSGYFGAASRPSRPLDAFMDTPSLTSLELCKFSATDVHLPWAQLTHVSAFSQPTLWCIEVLKLVPNLTDYKIYAIEDPELRDRSDNVKVIASSLQAFKLSLPQADWPENPIVDVFIRSQHLFPLTSLTLQFTRPFKRTQEPILPDLIQVMHNIPLLLDLHISMPIVVDGRSIALGRDFVDRLTLRPHRTVLLPALEFLELRALFNFKSAALAEMVESRWVICNAEVSSSKRCGSLRRVVLETGKIWDTTGLGRLEHLRSDGFELQVKSVG